jgi:hypothetical protein
MVECPVCGVTGSPGQEACEVCGLPMMFFEAVHDIANDDGGTPPEPAVERSAGLDEVISVGSPPATLSESSTTVSPVPKLDKPIANGPGTLRPDLARSPDDPPQPKEEALRIGESLGLDVSHFESALNRASSEEGSAQVVRVRRDLISTVLDGLVDRYRRLCDRRDVLSSVVKTQVLDSELAGYRRALSKGELARADEQRGKAERAVEALAASVNRIRTQFAEASEMMKALRELGGVAPMALRPVAAAIKVPHRGEAGQIERHLSRTNSLLWGLLVPRMNHEITKCLSVLDTAQASPARTAPIRSEILGLAEKIREQRISEALQSRRYLQVEMASLAPRGARKTSSHFSIDQVHPS